jgi:hypothetical protein
MPDIFQPLLQFQMERASLHIVPPRHVLRGHILYCLRAACHFLSREHRELPHLILESPS